MATVKEELEEFKIRLGKKQDAHRVTIVDHVKGSNTTCNVREGFIHLTQRVAAGEEGYLVHIVDHEKERIRKLTPSTKTIAKIDFGSNDVLLEYYAQRERIVAKVGTMSIVNHIIGDGIIATLHGLTDARLEQLMTEGDGDIDDLRRKKKPRDSRPDPATRPGPPPPRAEIPATVSGKARPPWA